MVIKNFFFSCTFLCCAVFCSAQIELDHTFSTTSEYSTRINAFLLEDGDEIYIQRELLEESPGGTNFSLSMEFTIFDHNYNQIGSFETMGSFYVQFASRLLFNLDDEIEFLIGSSSDLRVVNTQGDVLWEIDCETYPTIINTNNETKLIAECADSEEVRVYTLPGSLPSGMAENTNPELLAYPNPSKNFINIPTEGVSQIEVFNTMGQKVFEVPTNGSQYQQIPTSQLAPGTYIYQTKNDQEVKPGKMFVVE